MNLNYNILTKRNHKELTVEHYRRFLNKSVTITAEERAINDIFVPASIAAGYTWKSVPIFFAVSQLSAGNYPFILALIFMQSQR